MMNNRYLRVFLKIFSAIISIGAFLLIWHIATNGTKLGELMPGPIELISSLIKSTYTNIGKYTIIGHILFSLSRVLIAFTVGGVIGILLGTAMGWYKTAEAIFRPFYEMIRPIPPIAWISLAILWFGLGEIMKYFVIFLAAFSIITYNAFAGAQAVDPVLIGAAKMLGAKDSRIFRSIVFPSAVPYIFAGLHTAISASWATVVAAEMVRASEGAGWLIIQGMEMNNMIQILIGIIAIGIVGLLLSIIMRGVEAKLCAWSKSGK
ncbi:MAG: ABC transporter permease [Eubacteriales bacterium]|nr:ABC transporter permease [Eubacteriales bacterium]